MHTLVCFCSLLAALLFAGCAGTSDPGPDLPSTTGAGEQRAQRILKDHNGKTPIVGKTECIPALESVLDSITGQKYVFTGFAPERWATGGRQMLFVPYRARIGTRKQVVTLVVDDFCRIEGLIWPE